MAASDEMDLTIGSDDDRYNETRDTEGANCDFAAKDSNPGTSRYQTDRPPFKELKNIANESVDSKRLRSDESDVVGTVDPKKKKYKRIMTAASESSQATQESANKKRAFEDSTDSEDDKQPRPPKNKKTRRIVSSGSESSHSTHNKSIGISTDSEEDVQLRKKKTRLIASSDSEDNSQQKLKKKNKRRISSSDDDFESSRHDSYILAALEQIEAGSSEVKVKEEELSDSGSDDSQVSMNNRSASATSSSSGSSSYEEMDEEARKELDEVKKRFNHPSPSGNGNKRQSLQEEQESLTVAKLKEIQKELKSRPKDSEKAEQPPLWNLDLNLKPHQLQGLKFMLWRETCQIPGGMICDEMGLGKTGMAIALIADQLEFQTQFQHEMKKRRYDKHKGGTLIVTPVSILNQWAQEIENFCSKIELRVYNFHGKYRETEPSNLAQNYDIVITSYSLVSKEFKEKNNLFRIHWHRIILDEGHVIRNCKTDQSSACITLSGTNRWVVTGTPIQNEEMDLFALVKFLRYAPFDQFPVWNQFLSSSTQNDHPRLNTLLDSFMLRRSNVLDAGLIPEKSIIEIPLVLTKKEQKIHDLFESFSQVVLARFLEQQIKRLGDKATSSDHAYHAQALRNVDGKFLELFRSTKFQQYDILILLLRLRQITCHPALFRESLPIDSDLDDDSDEAGPSTFKPKERSLVLMLELREKLEQYDDIASKDLLKRSNPVYDATLPSTKMLKLMQLLEEKLQTKEKVIVVSFFAEFLKIIEPILKEKNIKYETFDGKTSLPKRDRMREAINDKDSDVQVLLLAMRSGGLGLNLAGANHMFILDLHWNPQLEKQVMGRISRIGQTKSVNIVKFICENTIEERILACQKRKLEIAENALDQKGNKLSSKLSIGELLKLFRMDDDNIMSLPTEDPDEEPLFVDDDNDVDDDNNLSTLLGLASN